MTVLRALFAGEIKKADHKEIGGKKLVELSICRKNYTKDAAPDSFTWLRIALWEPAAFQIPMLVKGGFIAGSGEMTLRSYEGKDGKASSLECRCVSFDVAVTDVAARRAAPAESAPAPTPRAPARSTPTDDEPPF